MKNSNPKMVEIIQDFPSLIFECKKCGIRWSPSQRNGRLRRGSWQCPNGCEDEEEEWQFEDDEWWESREEENGLEERRLLGVSP